MDLRYRFMLDKESGFVATGVARPTPVPGGGAFGLGPLGFCFLVVAPLPSIGGGVTSELSALLAVALRRRQRALLAKADLSESAQRRQR